MYRLRFLPFLLLLFVGTVCNSMIMSFMGFHIVDGLGQEPWTISLYAAAVSGLVILANRLFAKRLDAGANPFPMIGVAATGFLIATACVSISPSFVTIMTVGIMGFGASSSVMSTMFTLGGIIADRNAIKRSTFTAYLRATTSTAWMVGPAMGFLVADRFGNNSVFTLGCGIAILWLTLWWTVTPRDAGSPPETPEHHDTTPSADNKELWIAVAFVFCLACAHSLTFNALPLFAVREVGLPGYAPGVAFSVKTFIELFAIASTPFLIARLGLRRSLLGTACLAVTAILVLASVQTYPQLLAGAALEGLYFGLFSTLAISFVQSFSPNRPAHGTSMYWNTMMISLILAGPAAGVIAQFSDFRTVIFAGAAMAALSVAILGAIPGNLQLSLLRRRAWHSPPRSARSPQRGDRPGRREWLIISGQIPETPDGVIPESFEDQAELAWGNVKAQLAAAGMDASNVVKVTTYWSSRELNLANRQARQSALGEHTQP